LLVFSYRYEMKHFTGNSWSESPAMDFDVWHCIAACYLSRERPTWEFSSPSVPTITGLSAPTVFMMHGKVQRAKSSRLCSYEYTPIAGATYGSIYLPIFHKMICPYYCTCRSLIRQMSAATPVSFKSSLKGGLLNDDVISHLTQKLRRVLHHYVLLPQNNLEPEANYSVICYVPGISLQDLPYLCLCILFRHFVGLLGRGISPLQGFYLRRITLSLKTTLRQCLVIGGYLGEWYWNWSLIGWEIWVVM
jgi:hypothetical protein